MLRALAWVAGLALAGVAAVLLLVAIALATAFPNLPDISELSNYRPILPLRVFSSDGLLLGEFGEEHRNLTPIKEIPKIMIEAVLAIEDTAFYEHGGVSYKGFVRAALANLRKSKSQGASTITMQVARNVYLSSDRLVVAREIAEDTDLIVTAHSHARIAREALATAKLGGIGYHPSLLPRHRGIAAVEWTIREGDPIAGGTVYHLADRMDAGAIAAQEWVFVKKAETARELWERALAPLGQKLLGEVIDYAKTHKTLPATPQDEQFATLAPKLSK